MATTVNNAFIEFMRDYVNLDPQKVSVARSSRANIIEKIHNLGSQNDFFSLCNNFDEYFGSFARKTKIRKLDDIDLMIGLDAEGSVYDTHTWDNVSIKVLYDNFSLNKFCNDLTNELNSTKVLNKFRSEISKFHNARNAELHRNGEAVSLSYPSYEWTFDIVPCFQTQPENDGRSYRLIPNGNGNWKKTDPIRDRDIVTQVNIQNDGKVLELIRLVKKWNRLKRAVTMPSYLLETMIVHFCNCNTQMLGEYIDYNFRDALSYIENNIFDSVPDLKQIQGDLNNLTHEEKNTLSEKASSDHKLAIQAIDFEKNRNIRASINTWKSIFGQDFPEYEGN